MICPIRRFQVREIVKSLETAQEQFQASRMS